MEQVRAYKDGNRWIIAIEDTEKDIDDVVRGILAQLMTSNVSTVQHLAPPQEMCAPKIEEDRLEEVTADKLTAPSFVAKAMKEDAQTEEKNDIKDEPEHDEDKADCPSSNGSDPYSKAVTMLRSHKNSKALIEKLKRRYGTGDVEDVIAKRPKAEIISLFNVR